MKVAGRPVIPGGRLLARAAVKVTRLQFVASPEVQCTAGKLCTTLLQLVDGQGHSLQVCLLFY